MPEKLVCSSAHGGFLVMGIGDAYRNEPDANWQTIRSTPMTVNGM